VTGTGQQTKSENEFGVHLKRVSGRRQIMRTSRRRGEERQLLKRGKKKKRKTRNGNRNNRISKQLHFSRVSDTGCR
jgi:hypothetical protein